MPSVGEFFENRVVLKYSLIGNQKMDTELLVVSCKILFRGRISRTIIKTKRESKFVVVNRSDPLGYPNKSGVIK